MILPDINLLIHAHNSDLPLHSVARRWWDAQLSGSAKVGLPWTVTLGFVRIATHQRILSNPLSPLDALGRVEEWLSLPHFFVPIPTPRHFGLLQGFLLNVGTAGNLTTDAHLAALSIEHGLMLCSTDQDFARFPGIDWKNPLA